MIPSNTPFYGDQTRWFVGRVISINDPLEMGRVKVRIVGIHDNREIRDGDLPWAQVVVPVTEGGSSGLGALQEFAASCNLTYTSLYAQLLWTRKELTTLPYLGYAQLKRAETPKEAALIFMRKFERPGYQTKKVSDVEEKKIVGDDGQYKRLGEEERIEFAEEIFRKFE